MEKYCNFHGVTSPCGLAKINGVFFLVLTSFSIERLSS